MSWYSLFFALQELARPSLLTDYQKKVLIQSVTYKYSKYSDLMFRMVMVVERAVHKELVWVPYCIFKNKDVVREGTYFTSSFLRSVSIR